MSTNTEYGTVTLRLGIGLTEAYRVALPTARSDAAGDALSVDRSGQGIGRMLTLGGPSGASAYNGGRLHLEQPGRTFSVMDEVCDLHLDDEINYVFADSARNSVELGMSASDTVARPSLSSSDRFGPLCCCTREPIRWVEAVAPCPDRYTPHLPSRAEVPVRQMHAEYSGALIRTGTL